MEEEKPTKYRTFNPSKHIFRLPFDFNEDDRLGPWDILISEDAIKNMSHLSPLEIKAVIEKLGDISSGAWSKHGLKLEVPSLPIPVNETELHNHDGLKILWQVDCGFSFRSYLLTQHVKVWTVTANQDQIDKILEYLGMLHRVYTPEQIGRCTARQIGRNGIILPKIFLEEVKKSIENEFYNSQMDNESLLEIHKMLVTSKFVALSKNLFKSLVRGGTVFTFQLSKSEYEIINNPTSAIIIGRSGTGKTTCIVYRLIASYLNSSSYPFYKTPIYKVKSRNTDNSHIRQIFITVSHNLCYRVKEYFYGLQESALLAEAKMSRDQFYEYAKKKETEDWNIDPINNKMLEEEDEDRDLSKIPNSFSQLNDAHFPLFITYKKFSEMLEGTYGIDARQSEIDKDNDEEEESHPKSSFFNTFNKAWAHFVDYDVFKKRYWNRLNSKFDCELVYSEFSIIKGSNPEGKCLSREDYQTVSIKKYPAFCHNRDQIYDLFQRYEIMKARNRDHDSMDRTIAILRRAMESPLERPHIHEVYIDECQDNQIVDFGLILKLFVHVDSIFLAGDIAQCIAKGSSFRFQNISALMYEWERDRIKANNISRSAIKPKTFELNINYRSHNGILRLAASIIYLIERFFPRTIDSLTRERGEVGGPRPEVFKGTRAETLNAFSTAENPDNYIEFGAEQVIIVRNEESKSHVKNIIRKSGLVMTVYEAKGMEFNDVILYNFFTDSPGGLKWQLINYALGNKTENAQTNYHEKYNILSSELKHLYVAVTRARQHILIFDESAYIEPICRYWEHHGLVKVNRSEDREEKDSFPKDDKKSSSTEWKAFFSKIAKKSSLAEWNREGKKFFEMRQYEQAIFCFEKSKNCKNRKLAEAYHLRKIARASIYDSDRNTVISNFYRAADAFRECYRLMQVASCYEDIDMYEKAAEVYLEQNMFEHAAHCYLKVPNFENAGKYFKKANKYTEAAGAYLEQNMFENAARCYLKVLNFENAGKYFEKANKYTEAIGAYLERNMFENAARCYLKIHNYENAVKYFEKADKYTEAAGAYLEQNMFEHAARCYLKVPNFENAGKYFEKANKYTEAVGAYLERNMFENAARCYHKIPDFENAVKYFKKANKYTEAAGAYFERNMFEHAARCYLKVSEFENSGKYIKVANKYAENVINLIESRRGNIDGETSNQIAYLVNIHYRRVNNKTMSEKALSLFPTLEKQMNFLREHVPEEFPEFCKKNGQFRVAAEYLRLCGKFNEAADIFPRLINKDDDCMEYLRCCLCLFRVKVLKETMIDFVNLNSSDSSDSSVLNNYLSKAITIITKYNGWRLKEEFQLYSAYLDSDLNRIRKCMQLFRESKDHVSEFRALVIWLHIDSLRSDIQTENWQERLRCLLRLCSLAFSFLAPQQSENTRKINEHFQDIFIVNEVENRQNKRQISLDNHFVDFLNQNDVENSVEILGNWHIYDEEFLNKNISKFLTFYIYKQICEADFKGRKIQDISSEICFEFASGLKQACRNCRKCHIIPTPSILHKRFSLACFQYTVMQQLDVLYRHRFLKKEQSEKALGLQRFWAEKLVKIHIRYQSPQTSCPEVTYAVLSKLSKITRDGLIELFHKYWLPFVFNNPKDFSLMLECTLVLHQLQDKWGIYKFDSEIIQRYSENYLAVPVGTRLSLFFSSLDDNCVLDAIKHVKIFIQYTIDNAELININTQDAFGDLISLMEFKTSLVFAVGPDYCDFCLPRAYLVNYFDAFTVEPLIHNQLCYNRIDYRAEIENTIDQVQQLLDLLIFTGQVYLIIILRIIRLLVLIGLNEPTFATKIFDIFKHRSKSLKERVFSPKLEKYLNESNMNRLAIILHNDLKEIDCDSLVIVYYNWGGLSKFSNLEQHGIVKLKYITVEEFHFALRQISPMVDRNSEKLEISKEAQDSAIKIKAWFRRIHDTLQAKESATKIQAWFRRVLQRQESHQYNYDSM
ncbi:5685_t:CDS:10 [Ambispora gerdemannii]|uniref:5685_t:CDS:1 n=1 Tax=Ambispora gerdemannii TaxID=144530 RepID=A0A9N8ZFV9_9GLOM|nr:5685_t:CDS:10 [Ambispora gerdemannii]